MPPHQRLHAALLLGTVMVDAAQVQKPVQEQKSQLAFKGL